MFILFVLIGNIYLIKKALLIAKLIYSDFYLKINNVYAIIRMLFI